MSMKDAKIGEWYPFVNPAPLTDKILLSCGFERNNIAFDLTINHGRIIRIVNPGADSEMILFIEGHPTRIASQNIVTLRSFAMNGQTYFHELQNIVSAITGYDLKIIDQ